MFQIPVEPIAPFWLQRTLRMLNVWLAGRAIQNVRVRGEHGAINVEQARIIPPPTATLGIVRVVGRVLGDGTAPHNGYTLAWWHRRDNKIMTIHQVAATHATFTGQLFTVSWDTNAIVVRNGGSMSTGQSGDTYVTFHA